MARSDTVLSSACEHLEGSSFPIGGEGTHSVLSAHRGLPSAKLFSELDKLEYSISGERLMAVANGQLLREMFQMVIRSA